MLSLNQKVDEVLTTEGQALKEQVEWMLNKQALDQWTDLEHALAQEGMVNELQD